MAQKARGGMGIFLIVVLAAFLFFTNPSTEEFVDWAVSEMNEDANEIESFLGSMIGKPMIKIATDRKDYYLFSIFTVSMDDETKVLGIGRRFFVLSEK